METTTKARQSFDYSGYYFIGLLGLAILGFWPSYFAKFFDGTADFNFYFHFHFSMVMLWITTLIIQPILIRKKKHALHRLIGKVSYLLFPLIFISVLLLIHSRHELSQENLDLSLFVPFKDLLVLSVAYFIAIRYRHDIQLHARGMIATGIVFIEPALVRLMYTIFEKLNIFQDSPYYAYAATIFCIYSLLIALIIKERNAKKARWVFPLILGLYMIVHTIIIFGIHVGLAPFFKWFISLAIT